MAFSILLVAAAFTGLEATVFVAYDVPVALGASVFTGLLAVFWAVRAAFEVA